mgnify:CR=1 FL=1|nr:MAG TPA: BNR/Asp-box repeat protein [Bacteriophage sp.]
MIKIQCGRGCASMLSPPELLTAGMSKIVELEIAFTDGWSGLQKTAVFTNGRTTVDVLETQWDGSRVKVAQEVLAVAGRYARVGIYGSNADGVVLPTVWVTLGKVQPAADPTGDTSTDPTLAVWQQIIAQIGDLSNLTTLAKSNLVAAINEAAKTGSGSAGSVDMRVEGDYIQYSTDGGRTWANLIAIDTLRGPTGPAGPDGHTPVKGTDYWTAADKAEIAAELLAGNPGTTGQFATSNGSGGITWVSLTNVAEEGA